LAAKTMPADVPPVTIRPAGAADYDAVARLNAEVQQLHADALPHLFKPASATAFPRSVYDGILAHEDASLLLAVAGGAPVGYAYAEVLARAETWFRCAHRVVYLHHLCVAHRQRRRGYGARLVQAVVDLARARGVAAVELDAWWVNADARAFFARVGFAPLNLRMERRLT
jgi:ribosomal protein S18 acetylase RimI-like enzyme